MSGKYEYFKSDSQKGYLLRRNIHRLEKGMIMRPRRSIYATRYIGETVEAYQDYVKDNSTQCTSLIKWATSVLDKYFKLVANDPQVEYARNLFIKVRSKINVSSSFLPKKRSDYKDHDIGYEALRQLSIKRRSVRWYERKKVERAKIDQAIEIARMSPSACNRQPFKFHVFDDAEIIKELSVMPSGTAGFAEGFPCLVVLVGDLSAYFSERDRHVIYIDGSLAAMSFMFALETLGLSSCAINWPDIEWRERLLQKRLSLRDHERPLMFISLGYADSSGLVPHSEKMSVEDLRIYNYEN
jgi:nitroreductase